MKTCYVKSLAIAAFAALGDLARGRASPAHRSRGNDGLCAK